MARTRWMAMLEQRLRETLDKQAEFMIGGGHKDYAAYQRGVGYIEGLQSALEFADEAEKKFLGIDDREDN